MQSLDQRFHSLAAPSLFLWGLFPSPFCWAPLSFVSPFITFLSSKGLAWTRLRGEKKRPPASCQLCLWPIAPVSCLTLIPQFIQRRALGQTECLRNLPETSAFPKPYKQFPASISAPAGRATLPARDAGPSGGDTHTGCPGAAPRCPISPPSPAAWQAPPQRLRLHRNRLLPAPMGNELMTMLPPGTTTFFLAGWAPALSKKCISALSCLQVFFYHKAFRRLEHPLRAGCPYSRYLVPVARPQRRSGSKGEGFGIAGPFPHLRVLNCSLKAGIVKKFNVRGSSCVTLGQSGRRCARSGLWEVRREQASRDRDRHPRQRAVQEGASM